MSAAMTVKQRKQSEMDKPAVESPSSAGAMDVSIPFDLSLYDDQGVKQSIDQLGEFLKEPIQFEVLASLSRYSLRRVRSFVSLSRRYARSDIEAIQQKSDLQFAYLGDDDDYWQSLNDTTVELLISEMFFFLNLIVLLETNHFITNQRSRNPALETQACTQ